MYQHFDVMEIFFLHSEIWEPILETKRPQCEITVVYGRSSQTNHSAARAASVACLLTTFLPTKDIAHLEAT
jgi:hypothetical protein